MGEQLELEDLEERLTQPQVLRVIAIINLRKSIQENGPIRLTRADLEKFDTLDPAKDAFAIDLDGSDILIDITTLEDAQA